MMLEAVKRERDLYQEHFAQFERQFGDQAPGWLRHLRKSAFARFAQHGFPTTRDEDWRFTSLNALSRIHFDLAAREAGSADRSKLRFADLDCPRVVFVDGVHSKKLSSDPRGLEAGIQVESLAEVLERSPESVEHQLGRYADFERYPFTALNTAFLREGLVVRVAFGKVIERPLEMLFVTTGSATDVVTHPRILVLVEENAQVKLIESYASTDRIRHFTNTVVEVSVGANAVVEHFKVQNESLDAYHISRTQVHQERSTNYKHHNIALGSALTRNNLTTLLDGEGGISTLNGLFVTREKQHIDNFTMMEHAKPHCDSRELYKGILDGSSRGVFHGRIIVRQDAQKTDSKQTNDNLLLSDKALVNTKPQLEIYADDVKCTHGATIGQLQEESLFYLRARGIEKEAARSLLIYAFASEVIGRISYSPLRRQLHDYLADWLPNGQLVKEAD